MFIESKEQDQLKKTLGKLPKVHRELIKSYKIKFTPKITLKNDPKHIGSIDDKEIIVAAPWNYGREFTILHEIGHLVWGELLDKDLKTKWEKKLKTSKIKIPKNYSAWPTQIIIQKTKLPFMTTKNGINL